VPVPAIVALVVSILITGCVGQTQRDSPERADIEREAALEVERICALPEAQREIELKKIKDESGMVIYCGKPAGAQ
jgi:hypothetical protein